MIFQNEKVGGICVLISQMFERITFYSIQANFVYILNSKPLEWSIVNSMNTTFILSGFCFVATMIGGILSDTIFKKSTTVLFGYIFYSAFVGYILVFYMPLEEIHKRPVDVRDYIYIEKFCKHFDKRDASIFTERCSNIIIPVTLLSAIGSGLIKSVIASIGADMAVKQWKNPSVFFNMYYWSLNLGSLIAYGVLAYIQQNVFRFLGFLIPGITLILSFLFFLLGMPYYINVKKPLKNTINLVCSVYFEALSKRISLTHKNIDFSYQIIENEISGSHGSVNHARYTANIKKRADYPSLNHSFRSDSELSSDESSSIVETTASESLRDVAFFDRCKIRFGGSFTEDDVENVKKFSHVIIVLFYLIPYWILYLQMETTFIYQGLHMKVINLEFLGYPRLSIPVCWLSMMDILTIMILLPFLINIIYPFLRRKNIFPNNYCRIICGMCLAILSVGIAGIISKYVKADDSLIQNIGETNYTFANITVLAQIPQYVIMGISESQAIIVGLEVACTYVPVSMQGMTNGLFWFFSGVGSFMGTGLIVAFNISEFYVERNTDSIQSRYYFLWLALIQIFTIFLFIPYVYKMKAIGRNKCFITSTHTNYL